MLRYWQSHQEYCFSLHEAKVHFDSSQRCRLFSTFSSSREKLRLLNLDPVMEFLTPFYSSTGRPAQNQVQILRSLVLMLDQGGTSITDWVQKLQDDDLLAFLIGCCPDSLPPLGSYYDFIDRLWLQKTELQKLGRKDLFPSGKNKKPSRSNLCLDSAHDNYPTYRLCGKWKIRPFIDLNEKRGRPASIPDAITIDSDGTPICQAGYRMVYWGFCSGRSRCKWRCPVACGKKESCPCKSSCSPSPYGRCVYTKPSWDIRLYPPIPRGTAEYKKIYNNRTSSERVNDRVLNDYHLHQMGVHTRKRYTFFAILAGINIHLDARLKKQQQKEYHM